MTIELKCDGCQTQLRVPDEMSGKRGKCAQCGTIFTIPSATQHFWPPGMKPPGTPAQRPAAPAPRRTAPAAANGSAAAPAAKTQSAAALPAQPVHAPVAAPVAAPLAAPLAAELMEDAAHAAPMAVPLEEAIDPQVDVPRSLRDTVPLERVGSTRDTVRAPAATSISRPIPLDKHPAAAAATAGAIQRLQLGDVLARARGIFKTKWGSLAITGAVFLLVSAIAGGALSGMLRALRTPEVVQFLAPQALTVWLLIGMVSVSVKAARGRPASVGTLFSGMPLFLSALVIWVICFAPLILAALGLAAAGVSPLAIAAVIAGLWVIVFGTVWVPSLVALVDHESRPIAALRAALTYTTANLPVALGVLAISLVVLAVSSLPAGLALPLGVPFVLLLNAVAYLRSKPARG